MWGPFKKLTNSKTVDRFIEILNKLKKEKPALFNGATKSGIFTAGINDFISYGEEPEYKHSSFNAERASAIDSFFDQEIANFRQRIASFQGEFTNRFGRKLKLRDYIYYKLETAFLDQLNERQQNIKKGKFPSFVTNRNVNNYINTGNNAESLKICFGVCMPNASNTPTGVKMHHIIAIWQSVNCKIIIIKVLIHSIKATITHLNK